jgi:hypothetical protein
VAYGEERGAESFREELELRLARKLRSESCFQDAGPAGGEGGGADLLLRVLIHHTEERLDYDISMAQRDSPYGSPEDATRMVARMEVQMELQLLLLPEDRIIRSRQVRNVESYRPRLGEDPEYEVELQMFRRIARAASQFACKSGVKKLHKEMEKARREP